MPRLKTIAITRPREDAMLLAKKLQAVGQTPYIVPMLEIQYLENTMPSLVTMLSATPVQVIAVTSKHAVRMLAQQPQGRQVPVCAVGEATAAEAIAAGFCDVRNAGGDAQAVLAYIKTHFSAVQGKVIYLRGKEVALDMASSLLKAGFAVEELVVYDAALVNELPQEYIQALREEKVDAVMFFSRRSAENYRRLVEQQGLTQCHHRVTALINSQQLEPVLHPLGMAEYRVMDE